MKYLTRYYIGMQDKDCGLEHSVNDLKLIASKYFENFTLIKAQGCYKYTSGAIANETTYIVEVFYDEPLKHSKFINEVKIELNQECVLTYTQNVQAYCV